MNINDFFDPVELERPDDFFKPDESCFSHRISIHTMSNPIGDLSKYEIAIMGVPEDRNSFNKGANKAPDKIRLKLYQLTGFPKGKAIIDLGNLKTGNTPKDTYYGLSEALSILASRNIITILIGGTQDLTLGMLMSLQSDPENLTLLSFDSRLDYNENISLTNSINYLNEIAGESPSLKVGKYINLGHQQYLNNPKTIERLHGLYHDSYRLGVVRADIVETEPIIRDADIISLDFSSIKQGDAPGHSNPTPNGFTSDEICQLSRYAGISDNIKIFGLFEVNPEFDMNFQSAHLAAQIIWYFIEGANNRFSESPAEDKGGFKKFIVGINKLDDKIIFYKSLKSNRWWMEIPQPEGKRHGLSLLSCSVSDYHKACKNDLPDRWLRELHRLSES